MEFATSAVVLGGPGWRERLGELHASGVELIELWAAFGPDAGEGVTFNYMDPLEVEAVAIELSRAGLEVHSLHGPILLGGSTPEEPFGPAGLEGLLEAERAGIDALAALGGRFLLTQDAAEKLGEDAPHLASRDALGALAEYAQTHGCVFCIENGAESAEGFERLVECVRDLSHPGLGICLDVGHAQAWGYRDVPRAIRAAGVFIRTCHIHDNLGFSDAHMPVGDGILPWHAILSALAEVGYRGPLVLESWAGGRRGTPREVLMRGMELLRSVAGAHWVPAATADGCAIFCATEADRLRAAHLLGIGPVGGPSRAAFAVDRFGDPVIWAELELCGAEARISVTRRPGVPEGAAMAAARAVLDTPEVPPLVVARDSAESLLELLGYERVSERLFRRVCRDENRNRG